ncbi:unnamed protein product [Mortierella alpina]
MFEADSRSGICLHVGKSGTFCMMCLMEKHVSRCFTHSMNDAITPKAIVGRLRNIGKQFRIGRQEDSHEFARHLIDALQKSCLAGYDSKLDNRIKETTAVHQIFGGYFQSQVKCLRCGYESNTFETYLDVSLDIRGAESVQRAFRDYTKPETLSKDNQYKCDKCKVLVDARKQMTIYEAPKVLSVHLKRFTFTGQKINRHVKFDTKLELNSVMSSNRKHPDLTYSLYAVLVHAGGSCHSGHYYCYVKSSNGIWYSMNDSHVSVVSLQTVLSQNAYMLFYSQDKKGSSVNGTKEPSSGVKANGVKINGMVNGTASLAAKRPRLDEDEVGDRVDRLSVNRGEKRVKVSELVATGNTEELSKEERRRLRKERKKAKKLEKLMNGTSKSAVNDYDLATSTSSPASSATSLSSVSTVSSSPSSLSLSSSLWKAHHANGNTPSKNASPLADLDDIFKKAPTVPKSSTPKPMSISIPSKPNVDWTISDKVIKSPAAEELRQLELKEQQSRQRRESLAAAGTDDDHRRDDPGEKEGSSADETEQDGWTVKPRTVVQAIVVSHDEASASKREKLQALIQLESGKSSIAKDEILGEARHMLGSKVSTWDENNNELTRAREAVLKTLKPKHHRPDAYDVDYDRGKVKKVKTKSDGEGFGVGAKPSNKFQKEQDVRNLVKPKFKKHKKDGGKKLPNAL